MNWIEIAESLPLNTKTRIKCCGSNRDAVISHDTKGYVLYCFRCDTRIVHSIDARTLGEIYNLDKLANEQIPVTLPEDLIPVIPLQHSLWLYKAGIDTQTYTDAGIGWSDSLQRIILPVRSATGDLLYYQCRAVHQGQLPKYKNPPTSKTSFLYLAGAKQRLSRIVVCEDILSAIRVGKHTPACSILGTKTSDEQAGILSAYDMVSYWLDPDAAGIKGSREGSIKVGLATNTEILNSDVDPKNLPDRSIRQILKLPASEDYTYHGCLTFTDT